MSSYAISIFQISLPSSVHNILYSMKTKEISQLWLPLIQKKEKDGKVHILSWGSKGYMQKINASKYIIDMWMF